MLFPQLGWVGATHFCPQRQGSQIVAELMDAIALTMPLPTY
jgi:hypothetical protein